MERTSGVRAPVQVTMPNPIQFILCLLAGLVLALVLGILVGSGAFLPLVILVLAGGLLWLVAHPALAVAGCVIFYASGITAPYIPDKLNLALLLSAFIVVMVVVRRTLKFGQKIEWTVMHWLLAAFVGVLLMTMAVRGWGLQILGSDMWGGMFYPVMMLNVSLVFALPKLGMPARWWPLSLLGMGLLGLIPFAADVLAHSGVRLSFLDAFVPLTAELSPSDGPDPNRQSIRYLGGSTSGLFLIIAVFIRYRFAYVFSFRGIWLISVVGAGIVMSLMGGSRTFSGMLILLILLIGALEKSITLPRVFAGLAAAGFLLLSATLLIRELPEAMQRSLSIIPGIEAAESVEGEASSTVSWRFLLWEEAWKQLPHYWLVGKGYAFSEREMQQVTGEYQKYDELAWALVTSAYHNGPLSMLIGLGIFGLITGVGLMTAAVFRHWRFWGKPWQDARLQQAHRVMFAYLVVQVFIFILVYGDVHKSFPPLFFTMAILEGLMVSDRQLLGERRRRLKTTVNSGRGQDSPPGEKWAHAPPAKAKPADQGKPTAYLALESKSGVPTRFVLDRDEILIGRGEPAPGVDLEPFDQSGSVSRRHAAIRMGDHLFFLVDLGSTNGTCLNDGRTASPHQPIRLHSGDTISMGDVVLRFSWAQSESQRG